MGLWREGEKIAGRSAAPFVYSPVTGSLVPHALVEEGGKA
jgi:hypothetical protein